MVERLLVIGGFLTYCLILSLWGIERDRPAWRVLAAFASIDICVELAFPDGFGDWTASINGIEEILVANALMFFAWSPIVKWMMGVIGLLWISHLCLYLDVETGSNIIYDSYEPVIRALIVLLASLGSNGTTHVAKGIRDSLLAGDRFRRRSFQLDLSGVARQKQDREDKETPIR